MHFWQSDFDKQSLWQIQRLRRVRFGYGRMVYICLEVMKRFGKIRSGKKRKNMALLIMLEIFNFIH